MSSDLQVKGISKELKTRLSVSAGRNFRSINQEAMARIEMSFDLEDALVSKTQQKWIDEALAGDFRPGSLDRLRDLAGKARAKARG
jgi:hypothetical protein